jgi:hypothetical protein
MYITNYSLVQDIKILLMTAKILFVKDSTEGVADWSGRVNFGYGNQKVIRHGNVLIIRKGKLHAFSEKKSGRRAEARQRASSWLTGIAGILIPAIFIVHPLIMMPDTLCQYLQAQSFIHCLHDPGGRVFCC